MEKENKMGYKPIGKLLIEISLPVMVSMFILAMYNIVDSGFVSQINENAFTAVSIALPIQNLMIGLAVGTGVGINAILARSLGEKNFKQANSAGENGIFLALIHSFIFILFGFFLPRLYYSLQTENAQIIEYGVEYLSICTIFSVGIFVQITFERIIQSTGKTILVMISQSMGAIINILLDPIFIFGLYGIPEFGIKGAAIATVISQIIAAIIAIVLNYKFNTEVEIKSIAPDWYTIKEIYSVAIPTIALISVASITIYVLNAILKKFSSTAVAALGAYFKIQSFIFMPVFGLNSGIVPMLAYNYGARNSERARNVISLGIKSAIVFMFFGFLIFQIFPNKLLAIFNASDKLLEIGIPSLRIISIGFVLAGYNIVTGATFQALGNAKLSFIAASLRQIIVLLPLAYLFSLIGNINFVWISFPIAEFVNFIYCTYYLKNFSFKKIENLEETT